jgi:hypothetical protein
MKTEGLHRQHERFELKWTGEPDANALGNWQRRLGVRALPLEMPKADVFVILRQS